MEILKPLLIKSRIEEYERKLNLADERLKSSMTVNDQLNKDETLQNYINQGFVPSKTAQNSLNFLTREDESNLYKFSHIDQIQYFIRLIYILLNEKYEDIIPENLITNLVNNLFKKYNVDNFSKISV